MTLSENTNKRGESMFLKRKKANQQHFFCQCQEWKRLAKGGVHTVFYCWYHHIEM